VRTGVYSWCGVWIVAVLGGGVLGGGGGVPVESHGWFLSVSCALGCG
jgi:hypothetical protein